MFNRTLKIALCLFLGTAALSSCKDDPIVFEEPKLPVVPPESYDFENVDFSGQTTRLNQLSELILYVNTSNDSGVGLDILVMREMFENTDNDGGGNFTFSATKQLKNKCFSPDQSLIDEYFVRAQEISLSTEYGSSGVPGRVFSEDSAAMRLFDENGWEYGQFIENTIMGALCYYQATSHYLIDEQLDVDNETVVIGEGTVMQHHWDEAYGYFGAPIEFPESVKDVRYWAKYCVTRDSRLGTIASLGEAFRRGRQAINVHRYDVRDEARDDIRESWELVCAATAIHYINVALDNMEDDYDRNHALSKAYVFIQNLKYNEDKAITNGQIDEALGLIGVNFYDATIDGLKGAREKVAGVYEIKGHQSQL